MRTLTTAATLLLIAFGAATAHAQSFNTMRNGDYTYYNGTDANGGAFSGTEMRSGDYSYFNGYANGQAQSCTTVQSGSTAFTTCH